MKKLLLFLMGLVPFPMGFLMNAIMMENMNLVLPYKLLGMAWLLIWGFLGYLLHDYTNSEKESVFIANLISFVVLLLNLYQELILGHYWFNIFGVATQFYYLPLLNISFTLIVWTNHIQLWYVYIISFALMCAVFYFGCSIKKSRAK